MLDSVLTTTASGAISFTALLLCTGVSLVLGLAVAGIHMFRNTYNKSFVITLALMPAIVQAVIMLVNGNLGTGIAVLGAFSLIRFRSVPGTAREIGSIFFAMAVGLATGMGYVVFAAVFLGIMAIATVLLLITKFGNSRQHQKLLKITIPEDLEYDGIFDDLLKKYTNDAELIQVKTTSMGSLYELRYRIQLKGDGVEKQFIDELRCRNGNLMISCGMFPVGKGEL